jgi:sugar phosphate isomerase/epimerase
MTKLNPVVLAPTTLMRVPPLEYIQIAADCGYDGIGLRLYPSPGMAFFPVVGDQQKMGEVRKAIADTGMKIYDILTCYVQPDMDIEAMKRAHEFGAELGADYALVIGDDPEWDRMVQNFGTLCDNAAQFGLTCALETPVNRRSLTTLDLNLKLIADAGRDNAVLDVDPVQFFRSGGTVEDLKRVDPKLMPYTQICDATSMTPMAPYCMPGEGIFPLKDMLDVMPQGLPLSLEYHHRDESYTPKQWAQHALDGTRVFLEKYYAEKAG